MAAPSKGDKVTKRGPTTATDPEGAICQLKITLEGVRPPVWRRILVDSETTLRGLHDVLQVVMPWQDSHLHEFNLNGERYGPPDPEELFDDPAIDSRRFKLSMIPEGAVFEYVYDFGDGWTHRILVEKKLPRDADTRYPTCVAGKRASPPEDCGGVGGYETLVEALKDPDHAEHDEIKTWVGEGYDPEAFDLDAVNHDLALLSRPARKTWAKRAPTPADPPA